MRRFNVGVWFVVFGQLCLSVRTDTHLRFNWRDRLDATLNGTTLATLATLKADGSPELSVMFFTLNRDIPAVLFASANNEKVANIRADPRVSVLLNGYELTGVAVTLYGTASVVDPADRPSLQRSMSKALPAGASAFEGPDKEVIKVVVPRALVVDVSDSVVYVCNPFDASATLC
eukprot:CAMPEP_0194508794 /NCGR_PEP_ID=MMETSP0253-20130528/39120_1 /TAXON_ID=2966 /ORGANISM="Noctiluca scintillans" /LENGTH=174 /DNA_ID=CAMNT_0039351865 /DNA_START=24 /DNA_END=548 /DNA_ORIENTATION=-